MTSSYARAGGLLLIVALFAGACAPPPGSETPIDSLAAAPLAEGERLQVVATTSIVADILRQVGGDDILLTLPITIDEAVLGGKVTAPTIDGPVGLTIPPGTSSGQVLRLRARGVARAGRQTKGDQRVELKIVAPPDVDVGLREFLAEWRKTHAYDPRGNLMKGAGI